MFRPRAFDEARPEVLAALIDAFAFATVLSAGADGFEATAMPLLLDPDPAPHGTLVGHFARANPHWRALAPGQRVLAVFQGPDGYISPGWYPTKRRTGEVVPTWNFAAIHVHGRAQVFHDKAALRDVVTRLTDRHERARPEPWAVSDAPGAFIDRMLDGIVGLRIRVTAIEGKLKLSQNRPAEDRRGVIAGLEEKGDPAALRLAAFMRRHGADPATE